MANSALPGFVAVKARRRLPNHPTIVTERRRKH
jgi:hypothetical protein